MIWRCAARNRCISRSGFILEEGTPMEDFWRVVQSMRKAADAAGVKLVTGDTKVVDRGKADRIFINTAGIGIIPEGVNIHPSRAQPGDKVLISGPIAVHGIAIMSCEKVLNSKLRSRATPPRSWDGERASCGVR
jgi:hydrogenase expression/formation protein HypE